MSLKPRRVVGTNHNQSTHGLFGTVVGGSTTGLLEVVWLDYPDEGSDEVHPDNVQTVSEGAYMVEVVERRLDEARD